MTSSALESEEAAPPTRREWLGLAALATALGMIVLDGTIVGVALPTIIRDLKLDLTDAQWVNSIYAVVLAALLLSSGRLSDRLGRRRMLLIGLAIFLVGSVLAALSVAATPLIWARVVQAVGAALIMPATLSTVNATFRGRYRAAAFGVWGAVISGAAAVGPLAGGALTQYASWQWIFLVNIPIGIIVIIATVLWVNETRGGDNRPGLDVDGALLSGLGFAALIFGIIEGPNLGWWKPTMDFTFFGVTWPKSAPISIVPIALLLGIVLLTLFILWERHRGRNGRSAILDLTLFRLPTFSWGNLTAAMVAVGEFAIIFVLPLYLMNVLGLDVMAAGLILAAMAIGAFLSGASARHLAARFGAPGVVLLGLFLELAGVIILALFISASSSGWLIAAILVIYGLGLGLASAQLTSTVLRDVPPKQSGQGSATQSTVRQVGSALGTAFSGAALSVALAVTLPNALARGGVTGEAADQVAAQTRQSAGTTIEILRQQGSASPFGSDTNRVVQALADGFSDGTRAAMLVAVVFLALGLLGAWRVWAVARVTVPADTQDQLDNGE